MTDTTNNNDGLREAILQALGGYQDDQFIDDCLRSTHTVDKLLALFGQQKQQWLQGSLDIVEAEYQKMRTIGRQDNNGDTKLFVDVTFRHNIRQALTAMLETKEG